MTNQIRANGKQTPATVLYFLEDGRVTASPWSSSEPTLDDRSDQTVTFDEGELPWMVEPTDRKRPVTDGNVSKTEFLLDQLALPEETEAEVDSDEFEEVSDETAEVEQAFQAQNFSEVTQIEEIPSDDFESSEDAGDDLQAAIGAACSVAEAARLFATMPTLRPEPVKAASKPPSKPPATNVWGEKISSAPKSARATVKLTPGANVWGKDDSTEKTVDMTPVPEPVTSSAPGQLKDVDEASICLLASPQAVAHFQGLLNPLIQAGQNASPGSSSGKRAQWATAALFGQKLFISGRPVPAQKVLEKMTGEHVTESFPYAMLGALYLTQGDEISAKEQFDAALEIDSMDVCALLGRSEICLRNACPVEALVDVKLAINQAKLDDSPLLGRAEAMMGVAQTLMHFMK